MVQGVPQVKVSIVVPSNVMQCIVVHSFASLKTASQDVVLICNVVTKFLLNECGKFRFKLYWGSHGTWINVCKSVRINMSSYLTERTNKMQPCSRIYYSSVS